MRIELASAVIGIACFALSAQANGGEVPSLLEHNNPSISHSPVATAPSRGLDGLSPGNRLIAQALYHAQKSTAVTGHQSWSLERIAMARAGGRNWGDVFQQLKDDGLVEAETLGQVVTWYQYHNMAPIRSAQDPGASVAVKMVTQPSPAN